MPTKQWTELVLVVSRNQEGYLEYELLMSNKKDTENAEDFESLGKVTSSSTEAGVTDDAFLIGNDFSNGMSDCPTSKFDDVRIYSTALTRSELAGLIKTKEVQESEQNLDEGALDLSTVGKNVWMNGEKATVNTCNVSGDYEFAVGTSDNLVKRVVLYRPGNANLATKNGEDVIDVRDLVATIKASEGIALSSKSATRGADINDDTEVNDTDKVLLRESLIN